MTVIAEAILIRNRLLHGLSGKLQSDEHKGILGIRVVFVEPMESM